MKEKAWSFAEDYCVLLDNANYDLKPLAEYLDYIHYVVRCILNNENLSRFFEDLEELFEDDNYGDEARELWDRLVEFQDGGVRAVLQQ